MTKFLKKIVLYLTLLIFVLELIIRVFKITPEIPQRIISINGIQKYKINQSGHFNSSLKEKWSINQYGWAGVAQTNTDTIFSIIGDSYIENFMNPLSCHQATFLKSVLPEFSFFEAARSGMSFIEYFEVSKYLDSLVGPKKHFIYLNNEDFSESILEKKIHSDRMQFSYTSNKIIKGKIKRPLLKKILYNVKVFHYFYLNYPRKTSSNEVVKSEVNLSKQENTYNKNYYDKLLEFCVNNYDINNIVLVFHPETDSLFINISKKYKFQTIELNSPDYKSWQFENDSHWNCFGHKSASIQVHDWIKSNHITD